ncbi:MAG: type IV pilus assembly protein PilM [Pirellulales bacterium]|nr:type IV pilus assembly protein PilM [Pirellulales bacterium]
MVGWFRSRRCGPIGVDLGTRAVKLVQLSADGSAMIESAREEINAAENGDASARRAAVTQALRRAREGRAFQGRRAVLCVGAGKLFVQNLRVPRVPAGELEQVVRQEVEGRLPFPGPEAEVRFLEGCEVRHVDGLRREVIAMACHRAYLDELLHMVEEAGLEPVAIDVEPAALLRCYAAQYRRDQDREQRMMLVNMGASSTGVVIAQGRQAIFAKYVDVGGRHLDEAVAQSLDLPLHEAAALRRHHGDRRAENQDPEVARTVTDATRLCLDRLTHELSLCIRYYSVTFRGQPLARLVLGGGEATVQLAQMLAARLDLPCELGDPLRACQRVAAVGRRTQWDVAMGLALRLDC